MINHLATNPCYMQFFEFANISYSEKLDYVTS